MGGVATRQLPDGSQSGPPPLIPPRYGKATIWLRNQHCCARLAAATLMLESLKVSRDQISFSGGRETWRSISQIEQHLRRLAVDRPRLDEIASKLANKSAFPGGGRPGAISQIEQHLRRLAVDRPRLDEIASKLANKSAFPGGGRPGAVYRRSNNTSVDSPSTVRALDEIASKLANKSAFPGGGRPAQYIARSNNTSVDSPSTVRAATKSRQNSRTNQLFPGEGDLRNISQIEQHLRRLAVDRPRLDEIASKLANKSAFPGGGRPAQYIADRTTPPSTRRRPSAPRRNRVKTREQISFSRGRETWRNISQIEQHLRRLAVDRPRLDEIASKLANNSVLPG